MWDGNLVLNMFQSWGDNNHLSFKSFSVKLAMLCLVPFNRVLNDRVLDIFEMIFYRVHFNLLRRTKNDSTYMYFPHFPSHPKLCVVRGLKQYADVTINLGTVAPQMVMIL